MIPYRDRVQVLVYCAGRAKDWGFHFQDPTGTQKVPNGSEDYSALPQERNGSARKELMSTRTGIKTL